jgi:hypothetical protein
MEPRARDEAVRVGDVVDGFCGGLFGRGFWGPARVEAVGPDWMVARTEDGLPWLAYDDDDAERDVGPGSPNTGVAAELAGHAVVRGGPG